MTMFIEDYKYLMTESPINDHICSIKRPSFHPQRFFSNFMHSKSQNFLDLHISKRNLILHYFVEFSSQKQSNISEKVKKGMV